MSRPLLNGKPRLLAAAILAHLERVGGGEFAPSLMAHPPSQWQVRQLRGAGLIEPGSKRGLWLADTAALREAIRPTQLDRVELMLARLCARCDCAVPDVSRSLLEGGS